jgi:hypothetical protein
LRWMLCHHSSTWQLLCRCDSARRFLLLCHPIWRMLPPWSCCFVVTLSPVVCHLSQLFWWQCASLCRFTLRSVLSWLGWGAPLCFSVVACVCSWLRPLLFVFVAAPTFVRVVRFGRLCCPLCLCALGFS